MFFRKKEKSLTINEELYNISIHYLVNDLAIMKILVEKKICTLEDLSKYKEEMKKELLKRL